MPPALTFPHCPFLPSSLSFQVSTLRLKPQKRAGSVFDTTEEWKAEAKGVNEGMGVSSQGGWLGTCSADLLLDRCHSSVCSSSATGLSHFLGSLVFFPGSCSSLSSHQFRIPKETAKHLIGNGHSHPFNFIWTAMWDVVQSQCWWIGGEFPGHLFFKIHFSWF